jgi:transmembrane sensor
MQVTENLLQRFFDQQCSAEEANTVVSYLYDHPEDVERWLGPDWRQAGKEIPVPASYRKEMWRRINDEINLTHSRKTSYRHLYMSAAAVILLVLCGWWFFSREYRAAVHEPQLAMLEQTDAMELRGNTTASPLTVHLPDGSEVTLEPGSTIKYIKGFAGKERRIILSGNGFFEVEKDITKPFIVVAGEITTTALGTSFRVTENEEGITVKLYTGKVVVNKKGTDKHWSGPVYLLPGTAMTYSIKQTRTTVAAFVPETKAVKTPERGSVQINKMQIAGTELNFDNTPLQNVLSQMEERFAIKIQYDQSVINNHYFTGKVLPTDSADVLLNVIGNMNGLTIKKEGNNRFRLEKNQ